jgi:hypothetical protein
MEWPQLDDGLFEVAGYTMIKPIGRVRNGSAFLIHFRYTDYSNKTVDINSENCLDIRFKSQLRRVNLNQWIRPFYCHKAAFFGPAV